MISKLQLLWMTMFLLTGTALLASCSTTRQISSGNTNQCINVVNHGYPVAGTPLRVKPCDPWQNQQWMFNNGQITGVGGFCLDVQGSVATEGAQVVYVPCNGGPSQNWIAENGRIAGIGGKCIDIGGNEPDIGAPLIIAACTGSPTQQWLLH
jgi:hypothetical protein